MKLKTLYPRWVVSVLITLFLCWAPLAKKAQVSYWAHWRTTTIAAATERGYSPSSIAKINRVADEQSATGPILRWALHLYPLPAVFFTMVAVLINVFIILTFIREGDPDLSNSE